MISIAKKAQMIQVKLDETETKDGEVIKFRDTISEVKNKTLLW
jgi:hypothetical protein